MNQLISLSLGELRNLAIKNGITITHNGNYKKKDELIYTILGILYSNQSKQEICRKRP